jgi:hypothetical protein
MCRQKRSFHFLGRGFRTKKCLKRFVLEGSMKVLLVPINKNIFSRNNMMWMNEITRRLAFPALVFVGISISFFKISSLVKYQEGSYSENKFYAKLMELKKVFQNPFKYR